ncbi:MAG: hypothetical protein F6K63_23295 [Moorea sp. SIO1G6]|uniref:hypothetical protein n=1 Tax=Moorena sp. SIO1G6 TaxID=2607840 RepID=UPI0013010AA5|nr:hypothetical protein [Moorena sp. SIO1G6]NET67149.1 hypothetical protein [Moorena sp. SIO1G6]
MSIFSFQQSAVSGQQSVVSGQRSAVSSQQSAVGLFYSKTVRCSLATGLCLKADS